MAQMLLCPVCLQDIAAAGEGRHSLVVRAHQDKVGRLCPMSGEPLPAWDERSTRKSVAGRSSGICEHCWMQRATDMHHRISAGAGGKWHPANILHLCRLCHSQVTINPDWACQRGLSLKRFQEPDKIPVMTSSGTIFYVDDWVTT